MDTQTFQHLIARIIYNNRTVHPELILSLQRLLTVETVTAEDIRELRFVVVYLLRQ
jgi:hypothetical protein